DPVGAVPIRFVGSPARGPRRANRRAATPDLGAVPHRMILGRLATRQAANGWEAPGDLHSSGARRSRRVLVRTEQPPANDLRTSAEGSLRTPVKFRKRIAVIFLQA